MARIVYGVSGEGSGHSSRAKVIAAHLESQGHDVKIMSYDRGVKNLAPLFDVTEIEGLHITSRDNSVDVIETIRENLSRVDDGFRKGRDVRQKLFKEFDPHCVITDFEPQSAYFANHYDLPLITIDNQHRMRYMKYECPQEFLADKEVTKNIIRAIAPKPTVSLVTSFYTGELKNDRTFAFTPILREEILALTPTTQSHILVYLTSGFDTFVDTIASFSREQFIVYGYDRDETVGNITFKKPSKEGFLEDLASARAVMATAGFTLLTESLHLKKPYFAMPMKGQFEQEINGIYLEKLGYGKNCRDLSHEKVAAFLYSIPDYKNKLDLYDSTDNCAILKKLDNLLRNDQKLLNQYFAKRNAILQ